MSRVACDVYPFLRLLSDGDEVLQDNQSNFKALYTTYLYFYLFNGIDKAHDDERVNGKMEGKYFGRVIDVVSL